MVVRVLVDRITLLEPSIRAVGRLNLPETLEIFDSHFPRFAVFPGSLILQALVELAAAVVRDANQPTWELNSANEIRFRRYVRPGDELELWVERVDGPDHGGAVFRARAVVDETPMMTIRRLELIATKPNEPADA